jgi:hypothetical protein
MISKEKGCQSLCLLPDLGLLPVKTYLIPPSVTLILRISSGPRIPNWTRFTWRTGALLSDVLIDIFTSQLVSAKVDACLKPIIVNAEANDP